MTATAPYFAPTPKRARPRCDAPAIDQPSYVRACAGKHWRVLVWDTPTSPPRWVVYRCNSWRHEGDCAERAMARCFSRVQTALERAPASELLYCVLTFDQRAQGRTFGDPIEAYKGLGDCLAKLIRLIRRAWPGEDVHYVATIERHRSGWPHINVVIWSPSLADYVAGFVRDDRRPDRWLESLQLRCGFGPVAWWEPVRDRAAIADYIGKVAGDFLRNAGSLSGEIVKLTQLPLNAPRHMRRIRSSRAFLPIARRERKAFAGVLVRSSSNPDESTPKWRKFYEGHLRKQGLTVDEHWRLEPAGRIGQDASGGTWIDEGFEPDPDDRAVMFGAIMRVAERTQEDRDFQRGPPPGPEPPSQQDLEWQT